MMQESLPALLSALVGDVFGAKEWLGGSLVGTGFAFMAQKVLRRRIEQARDILLDELRRGEKSLTDSETEETVAVLIRYGRAAQEGAARLNLRLMAKVIAGQVQRGALYADEFLRYADTLATLRREEVVLLGAIYRNWYSEITSEEMNGKPWIEVLELIVAELVPTTFADKDDLLAVAGATTRHGLLAASSAWDGLAFRPTRPLSKLCKMAPFEAALEAEPA